MRKDKRYFSLVLTAILGLNLLFTSSLSAQSIYSTASTSNFTNINNLDQFEAAIKASTENLEPSVSIKGPYSSLQPYQTILDQLVGLNKYSISISTNGVVNLVTIKFDYKQAYKLSRYIQNPKLQKRLSNQDMELLKFAQSVVSKLTKPEMSDYQKELLFHDYIINSARYDSEHLATNTLPQSAYTAYGILINKSGVCEGYSEAFKLLLDLAGIECRIVVGTSSSSIAHAWNMVKLDKEWYMVDLTYDDPVTTQNGKRLDILSHEYFNITAALLSKDHTWDHTKYPTADSTKYNYFVVNHNLFNNYSEFEAYIISQIKAGKTEISCYVTNYDSSTYNLDFVHNYYTGSYRYSLPSSSWGVITIYL